MMLTILGMIVGGGGIGAIGLFALMPSLLTGTVLPFLLGSPLGRKVAVGLMIAVGMLLVLWRVYAAGKSAEKAKQAAASLRNIRTRMKVDDEISQLSADDRRKRLAEWVSDR
ncbi:MAG: hypothetical protein LC750_00555 [Actinobacteria bacterium]|nr:hypothetical protein [Actinomycetota bacterium]